MAPALPPMETLVAAAVAILLVLLLVVYLLVDAATKPNTFYPSTFRVGATYFKLSLSPFYKVWGYAKYIKPGMKLASDLKFELPFKADLKVANAYIKVCDIQATEEVPLFYPATMFLFPTMCVLAPRRYLFPVLGAIHTKQYFRFMKPLDPKKQYHALLKVDEEPQVVKPGVEVSFPQLLLDEDRKEVWNSTTTVLIKARHKYGAQSPSLPKNYYDSAVDAKHTVELVKEGEWSFPGNQGITYAKVSGDWNPIHINPTTAKMFGFPRNIAHGMFVCAKAFDEALVQGTKSGNLSYPLESEIRFRRPVFLPSKVIYMIYKVTEDKNIKYLYVVENPKKKEKDHPDRNELCLEGYLQGYKA